MPGYEYDQTLGHFTSKNVDFKVIKKDSTIRHRIETLKFEKNQFKKWNYECNWKNWIPGWNSGVAAFYDWLYPVRLL